MNYKKPKVPKQYRFPYGYPFQMKLPNGFIGWIALKHVDIPKTTYCYLTNRKLHKTDGPAVLEFYKGKFFEGGIEFWLNNCLVTQEEFWKHSSVANLKLKLILEI